MSDLVSKAPSFKGLTAATETSSRVKRANRKRDTTAELVLRRELWRMGLRYRTHVRTLLGNPDLAFAAAGVAVFCDGDFWHGRNWEQLKAKLDKGTNSVYWPAKIARNRERDQDTTNRLTDAGWRVVRLWETDIKRDPHRAALIVQEAVREGLMKKAAAGRGKRAGQAGGDAIR
jgi:DNA mismatch endonuclease (patch repair protein)